MSSSAEKISSGTAGNGPELQAATGIIFSPNRSGVVSQTYIAPDKHRIGIAARDGLGTGKNYPDIIAKEPGVKTAVKKIKKNKYKRESAVNRGPGHFAPAQPWPAPDKISGATRPRSSGRPQFYPGVIR